VETFSLNNDVVRAASNLSQNLAHAVYPGPENDKARADFAMALQENLKAFARAVIDSAPGTSGHTFV
jgi:hypothetical protein